MAKFKLETSFQFPFFKMNEIVSYSEVKKPSGIAYMILVLISKSKDKNTLLAKVLENFGVPKTLHYIYADTINDLIRQEILECDYFDRSRFNEFRIGEFKFTAKGKKIFADESIPTGVTKEAKIPVFYDIAMNKLSLSMSQDLDPKPLMDSAITEEFMSQFRCNKDVEAFINLNKGKRIPIYENGRVAKNELIKKEEIVTDVDEQSIENWVGKYDCDITLDGNNISFEFDEKPLKTFFDSNYSSEMVNKAIGFKNKFKFKFNYTDNLSVGDFSNKEIVSILIPKEIEDELKKKGQMLITKGNYNSQNYYIVENVDGLNAYDSACEFVIVDQADNKYAYVPGIFNFKCDLGIINIPLVLKIKLSADELKQILSYSVRKLDNYNEDSFKNLVKITSVSKDYERAYEILSGYLNKDPESNIVLLNEMKSTAISNANISNKYKELLSENYDSYLKGVNEDNLETFLKITSSIPKFLNIPPKTVLDGIFTNIGTITHQQNVYEQLVEKGFDKSVVVLYSNPVPETLHSGESSEKTLADLINYDECLNNMKKLTSISDFNKYVFDEENVDKVLFKKNFNTAHSVEKNIEIFRSKNEELFKTYNGFMKLFSVINDDFNMLDAALADPKNIKKDLIEKKITAGEYQFVFVNLSAKLEIILKNKFSLEGKLSDMLSEARKNGSIDKAIATDLHDFRENRNAFIHPEDRTSSFKSDDLRRWCKEIFELEEDEK